MKEAWDDFGPNADQQNPSDLETVIPFPLNQFYNARS